MDVIQFDKYHGTGNDFIIIDDQDRYYEHALSEKNRASLCDRRFGIGADGLILRTAGDASKHRMVYYNSDGRPSTLCGNGSRCIGLYIFLRHAGGASIDLETSVGTRRISRLDDNRISVDMGDMSVRIESPDRYFVDSGSPHIVQFHKDIDRLDAVSLGRQTRLSDRYSPDGVNVNFVQRDQDRLYMRTYERGVEDETWSCGTGVVAAAVCADYHYDMAGHTITVRTKGGDLSVTWISSDRSSYAGVSLVGPATYVYSGQVGLS